LFSGAAATKSEPNQGIRCCLMFHSGPRFANQPYCMALDTELLLVHIAFVVVLPKVLMPINATSTTKVTMSTYSTITAPFWLRRRGLRRTQGTLVSMFDFPKTRCSAGRQGRVILTSRVSPAWASSRPALMVPVGLNSLRERANSRFANVIPVGDFMF